MFSQTQRLKRNHHQDNHTTKKYQKSFGQKENDIIRKFGSGQNNEHRKC